VVPPWIFIYGTNIVDRGLKVVFFGLFYVATLWKRLNSAIFCYFLLIFGLFFRCLPPIWEIFCRRPCMQVALLPWRFVAEMNIAFSFVKTIMLLLLNQMLQHALCLSYYSNTEAVLFACLSSGWAIMMSIDCLAPRWKHYIKRLSQGKNVALCHIGNRTEVITAFQLALYLLIYTATFTDLHQCRGATLGQLLPNLFWAPFKNRLYSICQNELLRIKFTDF